MGDLGNRFDPYPVIAVLHPERFMQSELAHAILAVKPGEGILHLLRGMILAELLRQLADAGADSGIVHLALPAACPVIFDQGKLRRLQLFHHRPKIKVIEFLENNDIMQRGFIDGAVDLSPQLTAAAVAVFVVYQKICQITVPQVPVKPVISGQFDQTVDAVVKKSRHTLPAPGPSGTALLFLFSRTPVSAHDPGHILQQSPVLKIAIYDQFLFPHRFLQLNNFPGSSYSWLRPSGPGARSSPRRPPGFPQSQ